MSEKSNSLSSFQSQVLMFVGTHCQHCAPVLTSLSELVKEGVIDSLEVINVEKRPEVASEMAVQSVPWLRIGWFELEGVRTKAELKRWVENTRSAQGISEYYAEILAQGRVKQCLVFLQQHPETMESILQLMSDPNEKINVRLGIGVIMEELAASSDFETYVPQLVGFLTHEDYRIRQDTCHYLSLTQCPELIKTIEPLLDDLNEDVREEAEDSIQSLREFVKH